MSKPATTIPTIHLSLAAILRDIDKITKDKKNEQQGFKFRGIDDVYNHLHPIFAAHGVTCIPAVEKLEVHPPFENKKGNLVYRSFVTMGFTFTGADGSTAKAVTVGEGMDFGDKATAKAMSVAHKYCLLQTFLIPTSDIIDGDFYDPTINPREELANIKEEAARRAVMAGGEVSLSEEAALQLAKNRAAAKGSTVEDELALIRKEQGEEPAKAPETVQQPPTGEKPAGEAPAAAAPPAKRARKAAQTPAPAATTPAEPAPAPEKAPAQPEKPAEPAKPVAPAGDWQNHVVKFVTVAPWFNRKLGDMTADEIKGIKHGWVDKYAAKIALNPEKVVEAGFINQAFENTNV